MPPPFDWESLGSPMKLDCVWGKEPPARRGVRCLLSQTMEKPRVEVYPLPRIPMTPFLGQDMPIRGSWRGGGERADATVGPCVLPDTRPLWANICPWLSPRDHSGGSKPASWCRSEPAGNRRVFLEL